MIVKLVAFWCIHTVVIYNTVMCGRLIGVFKFAWMMVCAYHLCQLMCDGILIVEWCISIQLQFGVLVLSLILLMEQSFKLISPNQTLEVMPLYKA